MLVSLRDRVEQSREPSAAFVRRVAKALADNGLEPEDLGGVRSLTLSSYQGMVKGEDGEPQVVDLEASRIVLSPAWERPPYEPADPVVVRPAKYRAPTAKSPVGYRLAVILPDPQIGYRKYEDGDLDPFHDEAAMDVALQITAYLNKRYGVDMIVNLGDFIDMPEHSRYTQERYFANTTQDAINRGHRFLAQQRATCPEARIVVLEGNHDNRMNLHIVNNARPSYALRRAGDDGWPALSVPNLLRVDELNVEWLDKYPANALWLNRRLRAIHGDKVRSNGSTASAYANDMPHVSTIFGHVHRCEVQYRTTHDADGPIRSMSLSPGCLCRVDGAVPSTKSGVGADGRPGTHYENWQQGIGIVWYHEDGRFNADVVHIMDGWAIVEGREFVAEAP